MYFEIENTPEHIRRARRKDVVRNTSPKEECPRLILAPFSRPPQVLFNNVLIGATCERYLEVFNPTKQTLKITLGKVLPPGLVIHLPEEWLVVEPETCYCLTMTWTPIQPTALRETVRFTDEIRGRYDVIVVLKSALNVKAKKQPRVYKTSPGKTKKKVGKKASPVAIYKKKAAAVYNATTSIKQKVVQSTQYSVGKQSNKENIPKLNDYSMEYQPIKSNPFDSPNNIHMNFDTTEIFSNMRKTYSVNELQNTYDKSVTCNNKFAAPEVQNILRPCNKQNFDISATDIFDNLSFTPLKVLPKGPKNILNLASDSELNDSLEVKVMPAKNETRSVICITYNQAPNNWISVNSEQNNMFDSNIVETPTIQNKKVPNTSSPKELNSPNFTMNTELSRISDLSFFPQRFSTERKIIPKLCNETHDLLDEPNANANSDTFTKDSPNTHWDFQVNHEPPHYFLKDQPKMCRQALFKESQQFRDIFENKYSIPSEANIWNREVKIDSRSPPRSITPPLQSIPEESSNFCDTQMLDKTEKQSITSTFTMNRTFDKALDRSSISTTTRQTWAKKSVRAEPEIWKIPSAPPRKSLKPKASLSGKESVCSNLSSTFDNKNINQNISLNHIGNVYSQSTTVDPFQSDSYFYDEEAVHKFEEEFKRWLNYILTPPTDLDSNIEQKIDVGKAWLENRNKEVPAAPTKEQVCSTYHNSHRLQSLRRAAQALLTSPEIVQVFQKLTAQIEKKLIAIRTDRNLHLDVGLQKVIMELLLSYNPLWLRIGLEAIYGTVLPLKSNSDIDGLSTFILQRLFKNPFLKNRHSKSSAPNMLLPAYMEAIKKFTLKKFFMLVFFLDQAKQKKLISHDPCLFCRNAVCKESRQIIIRFTSELIAGIGDITKHLRPIGYVVSHKQSYLDEYKYAVHNIALDIRDGVRITKVMEIILMKNGLLHQLRTPAISRLQKIHNVQVALNALKEANFAIEGDITAQDIADGHREKTLSLLWQLIHEFRAPLFERASNVIQTWWRKKYKVILEKRKAEEKQRQKLNTAASIIQCWWRRIQYNRVVELQQKQTTLATVVFQKYCRMWLCRTHLRRLKNSVLKIEEWYQSIKMMNKAKEKLKSLKLEKEQLQHKSATLLQSYIRRWLCMKEYHAKLQKIILIQSIIRCFILKKRYIQLKKWSIYVQRIYKGKLLMREEVNKFTEARSAATLIQSHYRMTKERKKFKKLKTSVKIIEEHYIALLKMRRELNRYQRMRTSAILIQSYWRGIKCRKEYTKKLNLIVMLQRKIKAQIQMKQQREMFLQIKNVARVLQLRFRSYQAMKERRKTFLNQRAAALVIQRRFRAQMQMKSERNSYMLLLNASLVIQRRYRALLAMRKQRSAFLNLKSAAINIQRKYRAQNLMKQIRNEYHNLQKATVCLQRRFRAQQKMKQERGQYLKLKSASLILQNRYRAYIAGRQQKQHFIRKKQATLKIQSWFRSCRKAKAVKKEYQQNKEACVTIQRIYRALIVGRKQRKEYLKIRTAIIRIQSYFRSYIEMKRVRQEFVQLKTATVTIQRFYKSYLETKQLRAEYLKLKSATKKIQTFYRRLVKSRQIRKEYLELRRTTVFVQRKFRSICSMKIEKKRFLSIKQSAITLQQRYRALLTMRIERQKYLSTRKAVMTIQTRLRAHYLMKKQRIDYLITRNACVSIQRFYRSYLIGKRQRADFLTLKLSAVVLQQRYRALLAMRKQRIFYLTLRCAIVDLQRRIGARNLMREEMAKYQKIRKASIVIQRAYRAYLAGKKQRQHYIAIKTTVIKIQTWYRHVVETRKLRSQYLQLRQTVVLIQTRYRANKLAQKSREEFLKLKSNNAAVCIQKHFRCYLAQSRYQHNRKQVLCIQRWWRGILLTRLLRCEFLQKKQIIISLQSRIRGFLARRNLELKKAEIQMELEKRKRHEAALVIQAHYRGHKVRSDVTIDRRVNELRRRWQQGALISTQETLKERNEDALTVLRRMEDIECVIHAFRSLELLTEVYPRMYNNNASSIVRRVYIYMSVTNRSISSIELLKSAAAVLVNLTRYRVTGPKIYARDRIQPVLKFMCRFSNSEVQLFCILCTYLWLFSKYDGVREDLTEFLNTPENQRMLATIRDNIERMKRMAKNARFKFLTPQPSKFVSHTGHLTAQPSQPVFAPQTCKSTSHTGRSSMNYSICSNSSAKGDYVIMPALEPDYGILRADKPRYFEDPHQAITCLFQTYNLEK